MEHPIIIYNDQSNKAHYVYAIFNESPVNVTFCHMYNGLFLYKRPRSDEKFTYKESTLHVVFRTISFQLIFTEARCDDIFQIVYTGWCIGKPKVKCSKIKT